jgi:hypothetical protein
VGGDPGLPRRLAGESGAGLVATLAGLLAFLLFLTLSAHVLVHLYATSVVTAVAFDAARVVSGSDGGPAQQAAALRHARGVLGRWEGDVDLAFTRVDDDEVVLRVRARSPALLPRAWVSVTGLGAIDREVRLRREVFR